MEWFRAMPTSWHDTKVLDGEPGESVAIARKRGDAWFVGAITNNDARTVNLPLDMLDANRSYTAAIYADGAGLRDMRKTMRAVRRGDVLTLELQGRGGAAIHISPS